MEPLFLHIGPMRETWREGSYTENSDRRALEGFENGVSFIGLHKGNLRHLHGRAQPLRLLGWNLYLIHFSVMYNLWGLWHYFWPQPSKDFSLGLGKLNPEVIKKSYPRPIQAFIMAVERSENNGARGPACKRPMYISSLRAQTPQYILFCSVLWRKFIWLRKGPQLECHDHRDQPSSSTTLGTYRAAKRLLASQEWLYYMEFVKLCRVQLQKSEQQIGKNVQ